MFVYIKYKKSEEVKILIISLRPSHYFLLLNCKNFLSLGLRTSEIHYYVYKQKNVLSLSSKYGFY